MEIVFGKDNNFDIIDCQGNIYYQGKINILELSKEELMDDIIHLLDKDYRYKVGDEVWIDDDYVSIGGDYAVIEEVDKQLAKIRITRDDSGGDLRGAMFRVHCYYLYKFYRDKVRLK